MFKDVYHSLGDIRIKTFKNVFLKGIHDILNPCPLQDSFFIYKLVTWIRDQEAKRGLFHFSTFSFVNIIKNNKYIIYFERQVAE